MLLYFKSFHVHDSNWKSSCLVMFICFAMCNMSCLYNQTVQLLWFNPSQELCTNELLTPFPVGCGTESGGKNEKTQDSLIGKAYISSACHGQAAVESHLGKQGPITSNS